MKVLIRRLIAFAALMSCGCNGLIPLPVIPQPPTPAPIATPQVVELKITVDGAGQINVGGAGKIDVVASGKAEPPTVCPCCRMTGNCLGTCNKAGCTCQQNLSAGGNGITYERRQVCENGVCRIVNVPVSSGSASLRDSRRSLGAGQIVIYDNGSPAGRAMRDAIGSRGVNWKNSQPPLINGNFWYPTAVRPDGSAWTPGAGGWHSASLSQYLQWAGQ